MDDGTGGADALPACSRRRALGLRPALAAARRAMTSAARLIAERLGLPEIVGRLLAQRGVGLDRGAAAFSRRGCATSCPTRRICATWTPAVARLVRAIRDGETIVVFGDYDVDGATSAALLLRFFAAVGARASVYVPDRLREGYGPNAPALLRLQAEGAAVVVTVDCGATAHRAAGRGGGGRARRDRRRPPRRRAAAAARPSRSSTRTGSTRPARTARSPRSASPSCWSSRSTARCARPAGTPRRPEPDLLQWLDLVALGTVCDVVPLTGVNRALVAQGIRVARGAAQSRAARRWPRSAASTTPIDAYHLGFVLGPRVNAGGRVGAADLGARLLATDDPALAAELAQRLDALQPRAPRDRGATRWRRRSRRSRPARNRRPWCSPRPRAGIPG